MVPMTGRDLDRLAPLVEGWEETLIWSVLQGCMGRAWADRRDQPAACLLWVGDFCFFAGAPTEELAWFWPEGAEFLIAVPQHEGWSRLIEKARPDARPAVRYAFSRTRRLLTAPGWSGLRRQFRRAVRCIYWMVPFTAGPWQSPGPGICAVSSPMRRIGWPGASESAPWRMERWRRAPPPTRCIRGALRLRSTPGRTSGGGGWPGAAGRG